MKPTLTIPLLKAEAKAFCESESQQNHPDLLGITDGKAIGTYIEHKFRQYLQAKYTLTVSSSANGIDLPDCEIMTDLKVTSITQPQSSCPFRNARQKIFGLGYHLLVLVYDKQDSDKQCTLTFKYCAFIDKSRTADYTTTKRLIEMVRDGANKEDVVSFLSDRNIPGDEIEYENLAEEILAAPPRQGYLTISNALQWRLQYKRIISLDNQVNGVTNYAW